MFSILIPTFNNLEYLKICLNSIEKNSKFKHQIILHINVGTDGTLEYAKYKNILHTISKENIGMPKALNKASKLSTSDYLIISHDDFYFCPNWDLEFKKQIDLFSNNNFYLSGTMVGINSGQIEFNCGSDFNSFDETKLISNLNKIKLFDFQGTTKCPGLIHKSLWEKVGGWSEEFSPTGGDDTDFAMKLWISGVRTFKGLGNCLVYHFGSITTRKKNKNLFTYLGNKSNKIFILKWKISINFFEKYYLKSGRNNNKMILNKYDGPLNEPKKTLSFIFELMKLKVYFFYLKIVNFKANN